MHPTEKERLISDGLESEQISELERDAQIISRNTVEVDKLVVIERDWQSQRTTSSRRFCLTASFLIAGSTWIGLDLSSVDFFGLSLDQANRTKLGTLLIFTLFTSLTIFLLSYWSDFDVREARSSRLRESVRTLQFIFNKWAGVSKKAKTRDELTLFKLAAIPGNSQEIENAAAIVQLHRERLDRQNLIRSALEYTADLALPIIGALIAIFVVIISLFC